MSIDKLSSDSSLWTRSLRQLFKHGKPTSNIVCLTISLDNNSQHPFGLLTHTEKQRLIFWPAFPGKVNIILEGSSIDLLDHVTLEFPSKKIHTTAYDTNGKTIHNTEGWKAHLFEDFQLELWLSLMIKFSVIKQQPMEMFQNIKVPMSDKTRRMSEFENYVKSLKFVNIALPPKLSNSGNHLHFAFYLEYKGSLDYVPNSAFPNGPNVIDQIEEWEKESFYIAPTKFQLADKTVIIACGHQSGKLKPDVSVGLPKG